jgi:hypothetical protein
MTRHSRRRLRGLALVCLATAILTALAGSPALTADDAHAASRSGTETRGKRERLSPAIRRQLGVVRSATTKYRDPSRAVLDGYRLLPGRGCVSARSGLMGFHFVNVANLLDGRQDLTKPDYLLFGPTPGGGFELAGVEWEESYHGQPAPRLFGQRFDGPMAGHVSGQPVHYDLHVWVHRGNPSGTFSRYNPAMTCCPPEHHRRAGGRQRGTRADPNAPFLGVGTFAPRSLSAHGGIERWDVSWTHPDDWRRLAQLTLRLRDAGREVARVTFDQQSGVVRATGRIRLVGESGPTRHHPRGRRVTIRLALNVPRTLAGHWLSAEIVARDDSGEVQRYRRPGVVKVRAPLAGRT